MTHETCPIEQPSSPWTLQFATQRIIDHPARTPEILEQFATSLGWRAGHTHESEKMTIDRLRIVRSAFVGALFTFLTAQKMIVIDELHTSDDMPDYVASHRTNHYQLSTDYETTVFHGPGAHHQALEASLNNTALKSLTERDSPLAASLHDLRATEEPVQDLYRALTDHIDAAIIDGTHQIEIDAFRRQTTQNILTRSNGLEAAELTMDLLLAMQIALADQGMQLSTNQLTGYAARSLSVFERFGGINQELLRKVRPVYLDPVDVAAGVFRPDGTDLGRLEHIFSIHNHSLVPHHPALRRAWPKPNKCSTNIEVTTRDKAVDAAKRRLFRRIGAELFSRPAEPIKINRVGLAVGTLLASHIIFAPDAQTPQRLLRGMVQ